MNIKIRLLNFIIDSILFFIIVIVFSLLFKNIIEKEHLKIFMIILYYFYYFMFEYFIGQTIGKMITKTKVVNMNDDEKPNFIKIVIRTLSRLIPIDFLSYLFASNGIHDLFIENKIKTSLNRIINH